jgi:hypothetical protein
MWSFTQELIIVVVSALGVDEFLSKTVKSLVAAVGREPVSYSVPWRPCEPCNRDTLRYNRMCCK